MDTVNSVSCVFSCESFVVLEAVERFGFLCHSAHLRPFGQLVNKDYEIASAAKSGSFNGSNDFNVNQL